ncbi:MAG: hypothetical protein WDO24_23245 [Pseudomonadota bacterium]
MMSWLRARWAERSTKLALSAVLGFAAAYLHGDIGGDAAALSIAYAALHAVLPDNPLIGALGALANAAKPALALALIGAALSACAGSGGLTSTQIAQVGCAVDGVAQPIALPRSPACRRSAASRPRSMRRWCIRS